SCESFLLAQNLESSLVEGCGKGSTVLDNLSRVFFSEREHLCEHHRFSCKMVEVVVADVAGEGRLFDLLSMLGFRQYESALWSGKGLVSARCHRVRSLMQGILKLGACYESRDMRCIKADSGFMFLKCVG